MILFAALAAGGGESAWRDCRASAHAMCSCTIVVAPAIAATGARLTHLRLWETVNNYVDYDGN